MVDLQIDSKDVLEPNFNTLKEWQSVYCVPFLDSRNTHWFSRAFYFGTKKWLDYCLYQRVSSNGTIE